MFDLLEETFGSSTTSQLRNAIYGNTASVAALSAILVRKGIMTEEEFTKARASALATADQLVAKVDEEAEKEFDEKHPGVRDFFKKIVPDELGADKPQKSEEKKDGRNSEGS